MNHRLATLAALAVLAACGEAPTASETALNVKPVVQKAVQNLVFTSGANVRTWDAILPSAPYANWTTSVCTNQPLIGLNANWQNEHNAYVLTGHPWANDFFSAPWINAWNSLPSVGPGGHNWTKYRTQVTGNGSFVVRLLADNCSWIYLDNTLVGVQGTDLAANSYGLTLNGTHTLEFIIFDGGGAAGGKFRLETSTNPPPPLNPDLDGDGHLNDDDEFPLDPTRWTLNGLVNGSFERPVIGAGPWPLSPHSFPWQTFTSASQGLAGWTVDANTVDTQSGEIGFQFTGVPDGVQVLDLNDGAISQIVSTTANYTYRVSFALSQNYTCTSGATVRVGFGGTSQEFAFAPGAGEDAGHMRWDGHSFEAQSAGGPSGIATMLRFTSTGFGGCGGPMLDDVRIESLGPADNTPPVITPTVTGTLGDNDWYTTNVTVTWTVTDAESAITSPACTATTVTSDTHGVTFTCSATSAGGTDSKSVTIKRDASAPAIAPVVGGTLGSGGWYTSDVDVSWTVTDGISGIASGAGCSAATTSADNAGTTYACTATNGAGLTSTASVSAKRDATKPVIGYAGNAGSYTVDQTVAITCAASDAMSGLAANTCANVNGAAYTFAVGTNTFSATAADNAGNTNAASASFTVAVTSGSLCALVERWVSNAGVANSMCVKLRHGSYGAFRNELSAQSGKKISEANAATLLRLVNLLG